MGLNIIILNRAGERAQDWDMGKFVGDRDFADLVAKMHHDIKVVENWASFPDCEMHVRPKDWIAWRAAIAGRAWPNPGRFELLTTILEHNPDFYIYFSW